MKSATLPSLRVEPALREAFIARGIFSRDQARKTGVYHDTGEVIGELRDMLGEARSGTRRRKRA
jgi:hypothetical protein